jgi:recombination protein RecA
LGKKRRRQIKLDTAVATIHRRFGPRSLVKGKPATGTTIPYISTGFPALDRVLGTGGLPQGKVCELVGPATSGKTTLALKFLAQAQARGGQVAYVDQALYFDPDYAHRCGVDLSRLLVGTAHDLHEALTTTEALAQSGSLSALVFDAFDFLWTDPIAASMLASTVTRLPGFLVRSGTTLLVLHETIGGGSPPGRSPASGSLALSALAHTADVRLHLSRERWIKKGDDVRGYEARVEVLKNRHGPAGRAVSLAIEFNGTVRGIGL